MDLNTALSESKIAMHLFFNNKFDEAQQMIEPWYVIQFYSLCTIQY